MGLNSESTIKIIDLLCEGPIEGIVGGRKGVFLDETPLRSTGGSDNVSKRKVKYQLRQGSRRQKYLSQGKGAVTNVVNVNQEVGSSYEERLDKKTGTKVIARKYGRGSETVRIDNLDVDSIDLIFTIPRLFSTAQEGLVKGQLFDAKVFFAVYIQATGSGKSWRRIKVNTTETSETFVKSKNKFYIEGISVTNYQYKISDIELTGKGPWNIRVTKYPGNKYAGFIPHGKDKAARQRAKDIDQEIFSASFKDFVDADKKTPLKQGRANTLIWTSIIEKQKVRTAYPYSALVGMDIETSEFPSLPTRSYLIRGKKVQIPDNADPRDDGSLEFKGNFNGRLKRSREWTTCPVCIFYDLLVNKRFGAGHFIDRKNISWSDLYPLAKYCNEIIDGEPRFACNVSVASQAQAYTVIQDFASVFRGMTYWASSSIQVTADHGNLDGSDIDPVHVFSNSNVIEGIFSYSGSSLKTRSTSIKVRYTDPDLDYKPGVVCVEDSALIAKYGYQTKEILAFACTSKKQAKRLGMWMLKTEELDGMTVNFSVGLEGALVMPGQIFIVQDEVRAGKRCSGRISLSSGTLNTGSITETGVETSVSRIVTDNAVSLPGGSNPKLTCVLRNGKVQTRAINQELTGGTVITVETDFSSTPLEGSMYSFGSEDLREQKFRCITVSEQGDGVFSIVAVEHNDSIYNAVDQDDDLEFLDITKLDNKPSKPTI